MHLNMAARSFERGQRFIGTVLEKGHLCDLQGQMGSSVKVERGYRQSGLQGWDNKARFVESFCVLSRLRGLWDKEEGNKAWKSRSNLFKNSLIIQFLLNRSKNCNHLLQLFANACYIDKYHSDLKRLTIL